MTKGIEGKVDTLQSGEGFERRSGRLATTFGWIGAVKLALQHQGEVPVVGKGQGRARQHLA